MSGTDADPTDSLAKALDVGWVLVCTFLVFWEQAGFACWEAGSLPERSLHSILLKNMCDAAIGAGAFFSIGYGLAFGAGGNAFAGSSSFFLVDVPLVEYHMLFFQWAFAATAATTVSGCMAERTQFVGYLIYAFLLTGLIYSIAVHWVWSDHGFLCAWGEQAWFGLGMIDFAGSGVVHMLGGVAGLVGSMIVGPRAGRFQPGVDQSVFDGHSLTLCTLGVYCLWFGWFGFNAGYTFGLSNDLWQSAALVCINTVMSPSASIFACLVIERWCTGQYAAAPCMNAVVAGLVGITGPCGVVEPWCAAAIGLISGCVYSGSWRLHERLKIDDPVHAIAVHAWPGMWGCVASGLFATPAQIQTLGYVAKPGLFYTGEWDQLGAQLVGTAIVLVWTATTSAIIFGCLRLAGLLRVSADAEAVGVDAAEHGKRSSKEPSSLPIKASTRVSPE